VTWQGFSRAHTPAIEGLRHGGAAQQLRRRLTAFGSGWRGIASLPAADFQTLAGDTFTAAAIHEVGRFRDIAAKVPLSEQARRTLSQLYEYHEQTGFAPIIANSGKLAELSPEQRRWVIRHERIHALDYANSDHPFLAAKRKEVGGLRGAFFKASMDEMELANRRAWPPAAPEAIRQAAQERASTLDYIYQSQPMEKTQHARMLSSETLAYGHQSSKTFFREARAAGLPLPQIRKPAAAPAASTLAASAHVPAIEGLSHGTQMTKAGSMAARMRKMLTRFGSGWQGEDPATAAFDPTGAFDPAAFDFAEEAAESVVSKAAPAAEEAAAVAKSANWQRYLTRRNAGIAALVGVAALTVHEVKKRGEHRHDHVASYQPVRRRGSGRMASL
jgi:hypothetical protein